MRTQLLRRTVLAGFLLAHTLLPTFAHSPSRICSGDITLSSPGDITLHSECTRVTGSLRITQALEITGVNIIASFRHLTHIDGDFHIWRSPKLLDLSGFESLEHIGGKLSVLSNPAMVSLNGLRSLKRVEKGITVWDNAALESVYGMDSISYLGHGGISLLSNPSLQSLYGFLPEGFHTLDGPLTIQGNIYLQSLVGLDPLRTILGTVRLHSNPHLRSLDGLHQLSEIRGGQLVVEECGKVRDLIPLSNLRSITYTPSPETNASPQADALDPLPGRDGLIVLQPMPEVRCLPEYFLQHAHPSFLHAVRPRAVIRQCEDLVSRFSQTELQLDLAEVLAGLGLQEYVENFAQQNLFVEDFVTAVFEDEQEGKPTTAATSSANIPADASDADLASYLPDDSKVSDAFWPFLIHPEEDRARFREWIDAQNNKVRMLRRAQKEEVQRQAQRERKAGEEREKRAETKAKKQPSRKDEL